MPKKTFYNLPKEKQDIIIEAAKKEFARVPVASASIKNIVLEAGIARGSFYQYFESREDLFDFVFETVGSLKSYLKKELDTDKIDLFLLNEKVYKHLVMSFYKVENRQFSIEMLKNIKLSEVDYLRLRSSCNMEKNELLKKVDRSNLNVKTEKEFLNLVNIIFFTTRGMLANVTNYESMDEAINAYVETMNLLKSRFVKK